MHEDVIQQLKQVKQASYALMMLEEADRNRVLFTLADKLRQSVDKILDANQHDLQRLEQADPRYDRLLLTEARIKAMADDVESVARLSHHRTTILEEIQRPNGLRMQKVSVPLGVVAMIYEARPNVTIDAFSLCFKTGNACVLKGGKEAFHSNQCLVELIKAALKQHDIDMNAIYLLPLAREATNLLLKANHLVDVCIPRGSQSLIDFVRDNATIPFIETGAGIVHTYFDVSADSEKGRIIINNAKTRRVSVCNALDGLVIHEKRLGDLPAIVEWLAEKQVELFADEPGYNALKQDYPGPLLHKARPEDFGREFLSYKMSIKTVANVEEAVKHIMRYTSGHSEAIIAEEEGAIRYFVDHIDAAAVYVNASTAFTDGGQFGMGAEIGISTQKLHARGPMALAALTSYKWVVLGNGQIRS